MNESLNEEEKQVLKVLYEELARNPQTSLVGIDETTLGHKVGAYLGIGVMYSIAHLERLGLVTKKRNNIIITQKGLSIVKPRWNISSSNKLLVWLRDNIVVALIIAVVAGIIVAIILSHWRQ